MEIAGLLGLDQVVALDLLTRKIPPEALTLPGPLVPILKVLTSCESQNPAFSRICPFLPNNCGPNI